MSTATEVVEPEWLAERRRAGEELAGRLELPTTKTPSWEFTDLEGLDLARYQPARGGDASALDRAGGDVPEIEGAVRIDQVDGLVLSEGAGPETPGEPIAMPLEEAASRYPDLVREHLGSIASSQDPFVARNDSDFRGGAFVYVPAGRRLEAPVQITAVQDTAGTALNWRTLIVLEEGAEAEVWERYLSTSTELDALLNTVVELRVGQGASLRFVTGQDIAVGSWIFGTHRAEVDRDANLEWVTLGFGSARGKVRMETKLAGAGSSARVTGAYIGDGDQHLDFDTTQEHAAPSTFSDLGFRGVLDGRATSVWRGMIVVDRGAQQTDAFQENRNLVLSPGAHADAIPGLEIEADDVRCTHAAAIAQVDPDQVHYLRAHGLPKDDAMRLVIEGFMQELVERVPAGAVRDAFAGALERRLGAVLD